MSTKRREKRNPAEAAVSMTSLQLAGLVRGLNVLDVPEKDKDFADAPDPTGIGSRRGPLGEHRACRVSVSVVGGPKRLH
jgi:hypothetical protein